MFLSSADGDIGELLELPQGSQGPFQGSEEKVGFLSRLHSGKGPQLVLRGESPDLSRVARGCFRVMMGTSRTRSWGSGRSSLHMSHDGRLGIPLQSLLGPRSSSGVEARTSGFLSRADIDLGVSLGCPQSSQASSHVEPCKSALLSSRKSSVRLPVELTIGIGGFLSTCHRAVTPFIMF